MSDGINVGGLKDGEEFRGGGDGEGRGGGGGGGGGGERKSTTLASKRSQKTEEKLSRDAMVNEEPARQAKLVRSTRADIFNKVEMPISVRVLFPYPLSSLSNIIFRLQRNLLVG